MTTTKTPGHLSPRARRFWKQVTSAYVLEGWQAELLRRCCEQLDIADRAGSILEAEGLTIVGRFNQVKAHPAVDVQRAATLALARLLRELALDVAPPDTRPPISLSYGG
jgi:P27 family predicted phage terminase small subunit